MTTDRPLRILVTAKWLTLNRTSEGICSTKFLTALARRGHAVDCITSDNSIFSDPEEVLAPRHLPTLSIRHLTSIAGNGNRPLFRRAFEKFTTAHERGGWRRTLFGKAHGLVSYSTGGHPRDWHEVSIWRQAITRMIAEREYDLIFARGAGLEFHSHLALSHGRPPVPWVANFHDPNPLNNYPEPYRKVRPVLSQAQTRLHQRIIRAADALTFPSARLRDWILTGDLRRYRSKSYVVPHIGCDAGELIALRCDGVDEPVRGGFEVAAETLGARSLLHTGSLLAARRPEALIEAFLGFQAIEQDGREEMKLVFLGGINPELLKNDLVSRAVAGELPTVRFLETRLSYDCATRLARAAAVLVLIEASGVSPFFPAKFADYATLDKPVLALSPNESTVVDLVGDAYRYRADPLDREHIRRALDDLWTDLRLGSPQMPGDCFDTNTLSPEAIADTIETIVRDFRAGSSRSQGEAIS